MPILLSELWALITTYVRQETIDPLKGVGRYVLFGTAGALCTGIGVVMLAVGGLRVLQTETDTTFTGNLSWIPYGIVFVVLLAGAAACIAAIQGRNSSPTSSPSSSQAIEGRDR